MPVTGLPFGAPAGGAHANARITPPDFGAYPQDKSGAGRPQGVGVVLVLVVPGDRVWSWPCGATTPSPWMARERLAVGPCVSPYPKLNLLQEPNRSSKADRRLALYERLDSVPLELIRSVIDRLATRGLEAAYEMFSSHPDLEETQVRLLQAFRKTMIRYPAIDVDGDTGTGPMGRKRRRYGFFARALQTIYSPVPASLSLWSILLDERIAERMRKCPVCSFFFLDLTRNFSKKRCSYRCTSIATSRDYRAAGKEREIRRTRRVTSQPEISPRR